MLRHNAFLLLFSNHWNQEIIKVKVQSFHNVNDPEVKVAILEKIKLKCKDLGLAEIITVKWREQPDGVVFHKNTGN
ncbi:hypothetical protein HF521_014990 [Silurus meridionalis]|uniref:Uncharacterized protein n=1 Tax=Silurus meridionalis TaxID=175797 RepID=A0A8T0A9W0_SILME|nr:hypothetical protein HF521_014990 [Silurus meridionalis]